MDKPVDRKLYLLKLIANNKIDAQFILDCFIAINNDLMQASEDTKKYMADYEKQRVRRKTHPSSIAFIRSKVFLVKSKNVDVNNSQLGLFCE